LTLGFRLVDLTFEIGIMSVRLIQKFFRLYFLCLAVLGGDIKWPMSDIHTLGSKFGVSLFSGNIALRFTQVLRIFCMFLGVLLGWLV
jgi:hypothetical protein